jgi:peptidylprolyl isomerase
MRISLMFSRFFRLFRFVAVAAPLALPLAAPATAADPDNTLLMQLKDGTVTIEMRPDLAPKHVARIKELVRQHFYDGLLFHRVIEGFMAQTGDPKGNGTGGSGTNIPAEFTNKANFVRGTVGMARAQDFNSADSQFFICFAPAPYLDTKYTIWGQVTSGMDVVDKIKKGSGSSGAVAAPADKIITLRLASDH